MEKIVHQNIDGKNLGIYPLVMTNSLLLKMVMKIMDLPIENGGSFHSYVHVYQRVHP